MHPIYRFHDGEGTRTIDLRGVQSIYRYDGRAVWAVGGLNYLFDVPASVGEELEAAWRAYNGEHAPRPDEAGPGLPAGWDWNNSEDHTEARCAAFDLRVTVRGPAGYEVVSIIGYVRADVVEMTIRAHRARVGGAS